MNEFRQISKDSGILAKVQSTTEGTEFASAFLQK